MVERMIKLFRKEVKRVRYSDTSKVIKTSDNQKKSNKTIKELIDDFFDTLENGGTVTIDPSNFE